MQLVRWNPWNDRLNFLSRFNRVFNDTLFPVLWDKDLMAQSDWKPAVDVYDTDNSVVIKAELPGVDKKDLNVDINGSVLTLKGERFIDNEVKEEKYYRKERFHGKFERSFTLPDETDPAKIKAEFKDGVLKIEVPKPEEKKPRQITVH